MRDPGTRAFFTPSSGLGIGGTRTNGRGGDPASKRLQPLRITETIVIDGRLTEPAWALADVGRDFYQQDPDAGALSSEPSEIRSSTMTGPCTGRARSSTAIRAGRS